MPWRTRCSELSQRRACAAPLRLPANRPLTAGAMPAPPGMVRLPSTEMRMKPWAAPLLFLAAALPAAAADYRCEHCAEWNVPHAPFRLFGDSYYVGTAALSSVLVTSPQGHILLDGALPQSAPQIAANIRALGFKPEDVKAILVSHAHFDHAGGVAELAALSGARVLATPYTAEHLRDGNPDDPQFGKEAPFPVVQQAQALRDGEAVRVGPLVLTTHFTPGHTAGSASWTWRSCEGDTCLELAYVDSLTAPGYRLLDNPRQPDAVAQFRASFATVAALPCDLLVTPHPDAADLFGRIERHALVDRDACRRYADAARTRFEAQLAAERGKSAAP
jgi:metallo-beta-lactamase class B